MKLKEFEKIQSRHEEDRQRLERIVTGDIVWKAVPRGFDNDYHPAVVKSVNIDEDYVEVIDVSSEGNPHKKYEGFLTASEIRMIGIPTDQIEKEYEKYADVISKVKKGSM